MNSAVGGRPCCRHRAWCDRHSRVQFCPQRATWDSARRRRRGGHQRLPQIHRWSSGSLAMLGNACSTTDIGADRTRTIRPPGRVVAVDGPSPPDPRSRPTPGAPGDRPVSIGPDGPGTARRSGWSAHTRAPHTRAYQGSDRPRRAPARRAGTPDAPPHPSGRPASAWAAWPAPRRSPRLVLVGQPTRGHQGAARVFDLQVRVGVAGGGDRRVTQQMLAPPRPPPRGAAAPLHTYVERYAARR